MKHRSKAEKRRLKKHKLKGQTRDFYTRNPQKTNSKSFDPQVAHKNSENEKRIFAEDIFKLRDMSQNLLKYDKLSLINSSGIHIVGELVFRIREGNFRIRGIGEETKKIIMSTLTAHGIDLTKK